MTGCGDNKKLRFNLWTHAGLTQRLNQKYKRPYSKAIHNYLFIDK